MRAWNSSIFKNTSGQIILFLFFCILQNPHTHTHTHPHTQSDTHTHTHTHTHPEERVSLSLNILRERVRVWEGLYSKTEYQPLAHLRATTLPNLDLRWKCVNGFGIYLFFFISIQWFSLFLMRNFFRINHGLRKNGTYCNKVKRGENKYKI